MKQRDKKGKFTSPWRKAETMLALLAILTVLSWHIQSATAKSEEKIDQVRKQYIEAAAKMETLQGEVAKNSYELQDEAKWEKLLDEQKERDALKSLTAAERQIIQKESSFNPTAKNPNSTAFGLWQGLDSTRHKYCGELGIDPNTTRVDEQIACMRNYCEQRYGSCEAALSFHEENGWY